MFYFLFMMLGVAIGWWMRGHLAMMKMIINPRNWFRKADQTTSSQAK